ncbi:MAG: methyltransferase domain-containing protein [Pseudomonadota bacterium]
MRTQHFEQLSPVCPRCRADGTGDFALSIASVLVAHDDDVLQGVLHCTGAHCQQEFPIVDGIPLLVANVRAFVAENIVSLQQRDDLHPVVNSLLGDCAGPGSAFDTTRQHLSIYGWDSYADLDPGEPVVDGAAQPGAVVRCVAACNDLAPPPADGPVLDAGCSVGRSTLELASHTTGIVLGVDLHLPMLRMARRALSQGRVRYPRRRVGLVYDERDFAVSFDGSDRVEFWACDALNLPFRDASFNHSVALNLLDCVQSPVDLLRETRRCLKENAAAVLSTPYDWSPAATPVEAWLGGHSQRGPDGGASEAMLQRLLTAGAHPQAVAGFEILAQHPAFPWHTRLHDRSIMSYALHLVAARAAGA